MDYSTQGDPAPAAQIPTQMLLHTNNFFIPDGTNRHICDIPDKQFHAGLFENGHNAYQVQLPGLKTMLGTSRYLMDEIMGQFYAIYSNSYREMFTLSRSLWGQGELIEELAETRCWFGYEKGSTVPTTMVQPSKPVQHKQLCRLCTRSHPPEATTTYCTIPTTAIQLGQAYQMLDNG